MNITDDNELPQGIQLTPMDESFRQDPYRIFKRLREHAPVHKDSVFGRFFVTGHDDVKNLLHDKEFFSDPTKANPGTFSREVLGARLAEGENPPMLLMDEPDHRRLRSLVLSSQVMWSVGVLIFERLWRVHWTRSQTMNLT